MATITLTEDNFENTMTNHDIVIVDFWAPWCGPCKAFAPIFEKVSEKYPDVVFAKVDTDQEQKLANVFQIRSIPTLMIFREKVIVFSQPGMLPESSILEVLDKAKVLDMEQVRKKIENQQEEA